MVPFYYVDYFDVPRVIRFWYRHRLFLLASHFDEELDDFETDYSISLLPAWVDQKIKETSSWKILEEEGAWGTPLGTIPVKQVIFDSTRRRTLDPAFLDKYPVFE